MTQQIGKLDLMPVKNNDKAHGGDDCNKQVLLGVNYFFRDHVQLIPPIVGPHSSIQTSAKFANRG